MKDIEDIQEDFEFIKNKVKGVLLFGSSSRGEETKRSDIDICLVKSEEEDILLDVFKKVGDKYDVKIFEELPLRIKINVIQDHKLIFGDEVELSYYFYRYRKMWKDNKHRIEEFSFSSPKEMIEARRKYLDENRKVSQKN